MVIIKDNGIGIVASKAKNQLHNPNTNRGIELTRRRLQQLNKLGHTTNMEIDTQYNKEDVLGTQVTLTLPYKTESKEI